MKSATRPAALRPAMAAALLALSLAAPAAEAAPRLYGVVVGIDDYAHVRDLQGAKNDALDLAAALRAKGGEVTVLTDRAATRSAFVGAVRAAAAKARPGDTLVITFAGHGIQQPEALAGDEEDGQDEALIFAGFDMRGPGAGDRLRDNDVAALIASIDPGVHILFVADSCHSGTVTRDPLLPRATGLTRFLDSEPIEDDPLPLPDASTWRLQENQRPNLVFAAASLDEQETPELTIDGRQRGALSHAVARAIEGAAAGADGETSPAELRAFVNTTVRNRSNAMQTPSVSFDEDMARSGGEERFAPALFARVPPVVGLEAAADPGAPASATDAGAGGGAAGGATNEAGGSDTDAAPEPAQTPAAGAGAGAAETPAPAPAPAETAAPKPDPAAPPALAPVPVLHVAATLAEAEASPADAQLVWIRDGGQLVDRLSGDLLAAAPTEAARDAAILKWRAARGLGAWNPARAFALDFKEGDGRHKVGSKVTLLAHPSEAAPEAKFLTIVNLAGSGEVQFVFPAQPWVDADKDRLPGDGEPFAIPGIPVTEPVGEDSVLAILTPERPDALRAALMALNGKVDPEGLLAALGAHAADPATARVALLQFFTGRPG